MYSNMEPPDGFPLGCDIPSGLPVAYNFIFPSISHHKPPPKGATSPKLWLPFLSALVAASPRLPFGLNSNELEGIPPLSLPIAFDSLDLSSEPPFACRLVAQNLQQQTFKVSLDSRARFDLIFRDDVFVHNLWDRPPHFPRATSDSMTSVQDFISAFACEKLFLHAKDSSLLDISRAILRVLEWFKLDDARLDQMYTYIPPEDHDLSSFSSYHLRQLQVNSDRWILLTSSGPTLSVSSQSHERVRTSLLMESKRVNAIWRQIPKPSSELQYLSVCVLSTTACRVPDEAVCASACPAAPEVSQQPLRVCKNFLNRDQDRCLLFQSVQQAVSDLRYSSCNLRESADCQRVAATCQDACECYSHGDLSMAMSRIHLISRHNLALHIEIYPLILSNSSYWQWLLSYKQNKSDPADIQTVEAAAATAALHNCSCDSSASICDLWATEQSQQKPNTSSPSIVSATSPLSHLLTRLPAQPLLPFASHTAMLRSPLLISDLLRASPDHCHPLTSSLTTLVLLFPHDMDLDLHFTSSNDDSFSMITRYDLKLYRVYCCIDCLMRPYYKSSRFKHKFSSVSYSLSHTISHILSRMVIVYVQQLSKLSGCPAVLLTCVLCSLPCSQAMDMPNTRTDYDELKGIQVWNGIPHHEFTLVWFAALCAALGAIVQDGFTLLQTAKGQDAVGDGQANDEAHQRHLPRKARLASCILRYIHPRCQVYRMLKNLCPEDGVKVYNYIRHYGNLDYTEAQKEAMLRDWDRATMSNVGIKINQDSLFLWVEWIRTLSHKLGKSRRQERRKFLYGLPVGFNDAVMHEKMNEPDGLYVHPDFYPAHHPRAGEAAEGHIADKPDIYLAALAFYDEWCSRIRRGMLKPVPRGAVHAASSSHTGASDDDDENEMANAVDDRDSDTDSQADEVDETVYAGKHNPKLKITKDVICACCGGRGHFARVGTQRCLTQILGTQPPVEELKLTKYPSGLSYPTFPSKPGQSSSRVIGRRPRTTTSTSQRSTPKPKKSPYKSKSRSSSFKPRARSVETDPVESAIESEASDDINEMNEYAGVVNDIELLNIGAPPPSPPGSPPSSQKRSSADRSFVAPDSLPRAQRMSLHTAYCECACAWRNGKRRCCFRIKHLPAMTTRSMHRAQELPDRITDTNRPALCTFCHTCDPDSTDPCECPCRNCNNSAVDIDSDRDRKIVSASGYDPSSSCDLGPSRLPSSTLLSSSHPGPESNNTIAVYGTDMRQAFWQDIKCAYAHILYAPSSDEDAVFNVQSSDDEPIDVQAFRVHSDEDVSQLQTATVLTVQHVNQTNTLPMFDSQSRRFILDSGATLHCVKDLSLLTTVDTDSPPVRVTVANKQQLTSTTTGTIDIRLKDTTGKYWTHTLLNVCYHPSFSDNLLSVHRLWDDNHLEVSFSSVCTLNDVKNHRVFRIRPHAAHQYSICARAKHTENACSVTPDLLHSRFAHSSCRRLRALQQSSVGCPAVVLPSSDDTFCDCNACKAGAARRKSYGTRAPRSFSYFGERISSDLCQFPQSFDGYVYLLNLVDSFTRYCVCYPLKSKHAQPVLECLRHFLDTHTHYLPTDKRVTWHTDNGGEFLSDDLSVFCRELCVHRSFAVPYSPPHNAQAERIWGILLRTIRTMFAQSGIPLIFWVYAAMHACMLHNLLPSRAFDNKRSPYECVTGSKPNVSHIRVWGCLVWYYLEQRDRPNKLAPRAVEAVHLGSDPDRKGYLIYIPSMKRITTAYHVNFAETKFLEIKPSGHPTFVPQTADTDTPLPQVEYREHRDDRRFPPPSDTPSLDGQPDDSDDNDTPMQFDTRPPELVDDSTAYDPTLPTRAEQPDKGRNPSRSSRNPHPTYSIVIDDVSHATLFASPEHLLSDVPEPKSYCEAVSGRYAERWKDAMKQELESLMHHKTWELINRSEIPKDKKIIKSKWVFKVKLNRDGSIERFKARFVVRGFSQVQGKDYLHAFSATLRCTSLRTMLAMFAGLKMRVAHFDVKSAFTQSNIDFEIFVEPPEGFATKGSDGLPMVLRLLKSLYGTKQASRLWQETLRRFLIEIAKFEMSTTDPCLFVKGTAKEDCYMLLAVYVDDIVFGYRTDSSLKWFIGIFTGAKGFNANYLGNLSWFLGASIDQYDDYSIKINQEQYVKKMVEKFVSSKKLVKPRQYPVTIQSFQRLTLATSDAERDRVCNLPYMQLIGSLLYLSSLTRPDIAYHMSMLCSMMHDPSVAAYDAAIELLMYVSHTAHAHLLFPGKSLCPIECSPAVRSSITSNSGLIAFSDASWHKPDKLGQNMFGYVVFLFGGTISYASKQLKIVALSSAEAEYAAAAHAVKEILFIRNLLSDLHLELNGPTVLSVDNQAAIKIAENVGVTARNKHFESSIHFFRRQVDHRRVLPHFVTSKNQFADGFTKLLDNSTFYIWSRRLVCFDE